MLCKELTIEKDSDAGRDWMQKEKRPTEDEMVGWHHQFNGHQLGQILGDGEGQGSLACCSPWRVRHDLATEQWQRFARIWNIQLLLLGTFWIFFFSWIFSIHIWLNLVKAMVFPVVMYGCETWTMKKTERRRIDAFELWCWRRLLRVPLTAKRSNQSILKEISPGLS